MPKVILIAQVNDPVKWEAGFRTHAELFRGYSMKNHVDFTTSGNDSIICMEIEDMDVFQKAMDSQATADAMALDGVKRETVKMYVLDKRLEL